MKSVYSILSASPRVVASELQALVNFDPRKTDYELKLELIDLYLQNQSLYTEDEKLLNAGLLDFLQERNALNNARNFFEELGIDNLGISPDILPLFRYLVESGDSNAWRIVLFNIDSDTVVKLVESPIMYQELFEVFYQFFIDRNNDVAVGILEKIASEYGYELPETIIVGIPDDVLLQIVLNTKISTLPNLAKSSIRYNAFLNKKSTLAALNEKYGFQSDRSLADFVSVYYGGGEKNYSLTPQEIIKNFIDKGTEAWYMLPDKVFKSLYLEDSKALLSETFRKNKFDLFEKLILGTDFPTQKARLDYLLSLLPVIVDTMWLETFIKIASHLPNNEREILDKTIFVIFLRKRDYRTIMRIFKTLDYVLIEKRNPETLAAFNNLTAVDHNTPTAILSNIVAVKEFLKYALKPYDEYSSKAGKLLDQFLRSYDANHQ